MDTSRLLDVNTSVLASTLAVWRGMAAFHPARRQPKKPLELYDYEASPFCRLVREALTEMDLDAMIYPCPFGGERFRSRVQQLGGRQQYPFLVDPNTGKQFYESHGIVEYLAQTYRGRVRGTRGLRRSFTVATGTLAAVARGGRSGFRGSRARPSKAPEQPLELYSFEASPFSRLVREVLCELELPYLLRNTGKARWEDIGPPWIRARFFAGTEIIGRNRLALQARTGRVQVPYLIDPNTGIEMYESKEIIRYLEATYAV